MACLSLSRFLLFWLLLSRFGISWLKAIVPLNQPDKESHYTGEVLQKVKQCLE